jgi:hypothetical protein
MLICFKRFQLDEFNESIFIQKINFNELLQKILKKVFQTPELNSNVEIILKIIQ